MLWDDRGCNVGKYLTNISYSNCNAQTFFLNLCTERAPNFGRAILLIKLFNVNHILLKSYCLQTRRGTL